MKHDFGNESVQLVQTDERLELQVIDAAHNYGPVYVDFLQGTLAHRRQYGGGRNQLIAKAVGVKPKETLSVLDVTAGLGRDAFVLALLGCRVVMCERSPIVYQLLADGLKRAKKEEWFCALSLSLKKIDSQKFLSQLSGDEKPDVIYIDPMFPDRSKSALVKKEMRVLRAAVGDDEDAPNLLQQALGVVRKRVVVKRSKLAPSIAGRSPDLVYKGKSSRFDVYFPL